MSFNTKKTIGQQTRSRKFLNKDFSSFKNDLLEYARAYFPNANKDFSENSLGGLFLDFASYTGDVQSFYLDHQFHETDPTTAVELVNIERHLKNSGVPIVGSAPAVVLETFLIEVPATTSSPVVPDRTAIPVIGASSVLKAENGTYFELVEDVNFGEVDADNNLIAEVTIGNRNTQNVPTTFILSKKGNCISGFRTTETFSVGAFQAFKQFTLSRENVTEIISVSDSESNQFYEVEHLSQDTVFRAITNKTNNSALNNLFVEDNLVITPAPYRFTKDCSLTTKLTTLTFGGGSATSLDNDIIPDPSEFAMPLYGKRNFSRFTIDPGNLLQTSTLGTIVPNTTLTVTYRYGGGLSHNVIARSLKDITSLVMNFPSNPSAKVAQLVRNSVSAINEQDAGGGEDPPSIIELKSRIPSARASQGRIVSKPDVLARIYTMPSNFGRVFRAAVHPNPNNPLSSRLYVISRNSSGQLVVSPDALKQNLARYLNQFRMISDALDILDAPVINVRVKFSIVVDPTYSTNKNLVLQAVIKRLREYFAQKKMELDQPIVLADLHNIIFNNPGVLSVGDVRIENIVGSLGGRTYSGVQYDIDSNTEKGIVFGSQGSIFEVRYPDTDIIGSSI